MKLLRPFGIIVLLLTGLAAQGYVWPTDNGKRLSSNFGEFRGDHFHMGIDIKTGGVSGKPILAIADGHISQMRAGFSGYGKALYLTTNTGRTAVYGHLSRFSPLLEEILKNHQKRENTYFVKLNFKPEEFPITKGSIIGFSGNTGHSFAPHLHFELRDSNDLTLNPLKYGLPIPDRLAPVITAISINPLTAGTLINAGALSQTFPIFRDMSGVYHFPDTINCFGTIGLSLKVHDRVQGTANKYNIYQIELWVDQVLQFVTEYKTLDYAEERLITTVEDHCLQRLKGEDYHKLYHQQTYPAVTVHDKNNFGVLKLGPGFHTVEIKVSDNAGNLSVVKGSLLSLPPVKMAAQLQQQTGQTMTFEIQPDGTPLPITEITCYSFTTYGHVDRQIIPLTTKLEDRLLLITLPRQNIKNRILQFSGINVMGVYTSPYHWDNTVKPKRPLEVDVDLDLSHTEGGVFLQIQTSEYTTSEPQLYLRSRYSDRPIELVRVQPNAFLSPLLDPEYFSGIENIIVQFAGTPVREIRFPFQGGVARPGKSTAVVAADRMCSLQALPTSFYAPTVVWIDPIDDPSASLPNGTRLSKIYQLQPFDRPVRDSVMVAIRYNERYARLDRKALYYLDSKDRWTYLPTRHRTKRQTMIATLNALEAVAVLRDTIAPQIKTTYPANGGHYHYQDVQNLRASFDDNLAGIEASERNMFLMLDGELQLFAYQPIKKEMSYALDVPLDPGPHEIIFSVTDQVGNSVVRKVNFTVN